MENEFQVGRYYDEHIFDYEKIRLEQDSVVEYQITLRMLERFVKNDSQVADVGVGVGHYAMALARRNCRVHLVDVSQRLLHAAKENMVANGYQDHILGQHHNSATKLEKIKNNSLDAILLLGPFYHLCASNTRNMAIDEAYRVLKPGGVILASAINRFQIYKNLASPEKFLNKKSIAIGPIFDRILEVAEGGVLDPALFGALGEAFLARTSQFEEELNRKFAKEDFIGLESFFANQQEKFLAQDQQEHELWLDLVERTGRSQEGIANSEHILYVGRKA